MRMPRSTVSAQCVKCWIFQRVVIIIKKKAKVNNSDLENGVIREFNLSHQIYGSRKLRKQMQSEQNGHAA